MATLTETDIAESRRAFESCDLNGDGFIDPDEFHGNLPRQKFIYPVDRMFGDVLEHVAPNRLPG